MKMREFKRTYRNNLARNLNNIQVLGQLKDNRKTKKINKLVYNRNYIDEYYDSGGFDTQVYDQIQ